MFTPERRTRLQVLVEILEVCREKTMKTDIMYKTKTMYRIFNDVLTKAGQYGLVKKNRSRHRHKYSTTLKGQQFLEKYQELQTFLKRGKPNE